jgi:hypothetical protein
VRRELPVWACPALMGWLTVVLWLDRAGGGGGLWQQRGLGLLTWGVLLLTLREVSPTVRAQTLMVVAFATCIEYVFSPTLEVYTYRFDNVPAFVPPGHGLVYLGALAIGRSAYVERHGRVLVPLTLAVAGGYAFWGLVLSGRRDVLGAFWFLCLAAFLLRGRHPRQPRQRSQSSLVFVGAFLVVTYLELLGTGLGTWTWQVRDPILGVVAMGNPPSGAAGGYGFFDAAALWLAPWIAALLARRQRGEDVVVQQPVRAQHAAAVGTVDA